MFRVVIPSARWKTPQKLFINKPPQFSRTSTVLWFKLVESSNHIRKALCQKGTLRKIVIATYDFFESMTMTFFDIPKTHSFYCLLDTGKTNRLANAI